MLFCAEMLFKQVVGQEEVKSRLRGLVKSGKIPHAMLLSGEEGVGKLVLALALAQYIVCERKDESDSCGECPSCLQWGKYEHPDLHFVFPVVKKSDETPVSDDYIDTWRTMLRKSPYFGLDEWYNAIGANGKQGLIYEKESSEILRKLSLKAFGNGPKVVIIWHPEKMHPNCSNKLLKIIEEPPAETIFILVTDTPEQVLPTILSRTQTIRIGRLAEQEISLALAERYPQLSSTEVIDASHLASGSMLKALRNVGADGERSEFLDWWRIVMRKAWLVGNMRDYDALLFLKKWSSELRYDDEKEVDEKGNPIQHRTIIAAGREVQKAFLDYAIRQTRENYIRNFGYPQLNYQTQEEGEFSTRFAPFINSKNVEALVEQFTIARRQIEMNGNAKMIFFDLCLQLIVLIK